jgi:hypothetical protein
VYDAKPSAWSSRQFRPTGANGQTGNSFAGQISIETFHDLTLIPAVAMISHEGIPAFVTSRSYPLPPSAEEMAAAVWFNMWRRRLWPFDEVAAGDLLYWYDATLRAIAWKTRISDVERFEYPDKSHVRQQLAERFGRDPANDSYFMDAAERGYCLAFIVTPVERLNIAKPDDFRFPQAGWFRRPDAGAAAWFSSMEVSGSDGRFTPGLLQAATTAAAENYFEGINPEDERRRTLREIVQRRGQPEFRARLIREYEGRCCVTRCDAVSALEAAHILPYAGIQSNHIANGLLLRADVHTLFDLDLLAIDPSSLKVVLAPQLWGTSYMHVDGTQITIPADPAARPAVDALAERWTMFNGGH